MYFIHDIYEAIIRDKFACLVYLGKENQSLIIFLFWWSFLSPKLQEAPLSLFGFFSEMYLIYCNYIELLLKNTVSHL